MPQLSGSSILLVSRMETLSISHPLSLDQGPGAVPVRHPAGRHLGARPGVPLLPQAGQPGGGGQMTKQINRQTVRQANRQTCKHTGKQKYRQTSKRANKQYRQTNIQSYRQTDIQANRPESLKAADMQTLSGEHFGLLGNTMNQNLRTFVGLVHLSQITQGKSKTN